ncbi:carboxypeptidase-like regulatory domain-containing protein [Pedobacter psychrodurus]|uniref:Carboxypeptidase-like regulatory domain-containing protein n=1 Tax=Pedobacter psychrodurus TaxID=2530456 RepID=A0A4R0PJP1_9SPHI|nr:carboxypeptidase-like regulatory domain-containing protein [Pedobacter psychrodurus]TCD20326.1 carboxypeptidase-like regulatory domain-containing protein [Pedobacter psychrodurus]
MPRKFKIQISNPCHEEWDRMQNRVNGKFCGSCQKSVIDFTHFSDRDLRNWFAANQGKSCGRLKPEQLDRLIHVKSNFAISRFKPSLIAASLFAFLSFPKLGNANISSSYPTFQTDNKKSLKDDVLKENAEDDFVTIRGKVIGKEDKLPLIAVSIRIENSKIGTTTDRNGDFELRLNRKDFKNKVILDIRYIGFESKELKVNLSKNDVIFVKMKMDQSILGGLAIINYPTFLDRITQLLNG